MATKETKTTKSATTVMNEDNVLDNLKNANKMPEGLADEVQKEIEQEEKDKKKSILKTAILKANYWNMKELLQLRQRRREEKITKDALVRSKESLDKLKAGEITPNEYEELLRTSQKTKSDAVSESNKEFRKELSELQSSLSGEYVWDWDRF